MSEDWRDLCAGGRIQIVRLPNEWEQPSYHVPPCTRRLYKKLIERQRPARICEIDDQGLPWMRCRIRDKVGAWEYHWLAVTDDSWVRARSRS